MIPSIYLVPNRSDRTNGSTEGEKAGQAGGRIDEEKFKLENWIPFSCRWLNARWHFLILLIPSIDSWRVLAARLASFRIRSIHNGTWFDAFFAWFDGLGMWFSLHFLFPGYCRPQGICVYSSVPFYARLLKDYLRAESSLPSNYQTPLPFSVARGCMDGRLHV